MPPACYPSVRSVLPAVDREPGWLVALCILRRSGAMVDLSRRGMLQLGGLAALSLPRLFAAQAAQAQQASKLQPRIRSCIFIFYYGGPSHLDTFDMKPNA